MSKLSAVKRKSSGKSPKGKSPALSTPVWFRPKPTQTQEDVDSSDSDEPIATVKMKMSGRNSACTSGSGGSLKENRKDPDSDGSDVLVLSPKLRKFTIAISPLKPDKIRKFTGDKDEKTDSEEDECLSVLKSKLQKGRSLDGANKLKQTSLLDFKTKKTSTSRASNRSDQPKKPKELRLENLAKLREKVGRTGDKYKAAVLKLAGSLSVEQIAAVKDSIVQADLKEQFELIKISKMSEEEKIAYQQQKLEEKKRQRAQAILTARMKFDESTLKLKSLPITQPVELPYDLDFGDLMEVVEFLNCFGLLLSPQRKATKPLSAAEFLQLICPDADGSDKQRLQKFLVSLLRLILTDKISESWTAYDTPLSELELNPEISSELLRQVLARSDQMDEANQLVNVDFVDLPPTVKVSQLKWLVGLALNCESIEEFQSDWQEKYAEAHRQRLIDQKSEGRNEVESDVEANDNVTLAHFYGPKVKAKLSTVPTTDETGDQTDLVSLVKRRRIEAAEERQRQKATEKAEAERRRLEEIERIYEEICQTARNSVRITQLGADRNGWRYWLFDRQICPGLFVEKFDPTEDNKKSEWRCYTTSSKVDQLLSALHPKGMNEAKLRVELQRKLKEIRGNLADFQPLPTAKDLIKSSRPIDQQPTFADKLKRQLVDLNTELKQAALGGLADFDSLQISTENADKLRDLASIIEAIFQSVPPQMFTGWLKKPLEEIIKLEARQYNVQAAGLVQHLEKKRAREISKLESDYSQKVESWLTAVRQSETLSQLHFLLEIFHSCVDWSKSVANAHCKVCKKSHNEAEIVLCDLCNGPYHLYCLKPKLTEVPQGNWFCSTCKPQPKETKAVLGAEEDSEPIHQVDIVHNTNCLDCTGEQDENEFELISCASCPYVYHRSCHNPPLRNFPRGSWQCWRCHADNPVNVSDDKHEAALSTDKREGLRPSKSVDYREESRHSDDDKSTDERIAVEMRCAETFDRLVKSRLTASLLSLPKVINVRSRGAALFSISDLTGVKEKLGKYRSVEAFFKDLNGVISHARDVYKGNQRKLDTLDEFEVLVKSIEENI